MDSVCSAEVDCPCTAFAPVPMFKRAFPPCANCGHQFAFHPSAVDFYERISGSSWTKSSSALTALSTSETHNPFAQIIEPFNPFAQRLRPEFQSTRPITPAASVAIPQIVRPTADRLSNALELSQVNTSVSPAPSQCHDEPISQLQHDQLQRVLPVAQDTEMPAPFTMTIKLRVPSTANPIVSPSNGARPAPQNVAPGPQTVAPAVSKATRGRTTAPKPAPRKKAVPKALVTHVLFWPTRADSTTNAWEQVILDVHTKSLKRIMEDQYKPANSGDRLIAECFHGGETGPQDLADYTYWAAVTLQPSDDEETIWTKLKIAIPKLAEFTCEDFGLCVRSGNFRLGSPEKTKYLKGLAKYLDFNAFKTTIIRHKVSPSSFDSINISILGLRADGPLGLSCADQLAPAWAMDFFRKLEAYSYSAKGQILGGTTRSNRTVRPPPKIEEAVKSETVVHPDLDPMLELHDADFSAEHGIWEQGY